MPTWVISVFQAIIGGILSWFKQEKAAQHESEAKAARDALDSVGDSINVENKIKDKQNEVDKESVVNEDGDINFDSFNSSDN